MFHDYLSYLEFGVKYGSLWTFLKYFVSLYQRDLIIYTLLMGLQVVNSLPNHTVTMRWLTNGSVCSCYTVIFYCLVFILRKGRVLVTNLQIVTFYFNIFIAFVARHITSLFFRCACILSTHLAFWIALLVHH